MMCPIEGAVFGLERKAKLWFGYSCDCDGTGVDAAV